MLSVTGEYGKVIPPSSCSRQAFPKTEPLRALDEAGGQVAETQSEAGKVAGVSGVPRVGVTGLSL